ncbi:MAG TPA: hypothetical protein VMA13_08740, partial [Candidatus Saccharimonadales bacterium]|nr:hypothetical protein [Candidatus Saccharimonadales bacterium]
MKTAVAAKDSAATNMPAGGWACGRARRGRRRETQSRLLPSDTPFGAIHHRAVRARQSTHREVVNNSAGSYVDAGQELAPPVSR